MTASSITVIRCDVHGCRRTFETGWPVTDETARAYAARSGWRGKDGVDVCPTHARTEGGPQR